MKNSKNYILGPRITKWKIRGQREQPLCEFSHWAAGVEIVSNPNFVHQKCDFSEFDSDLLHKRVKLHLRAMLCSRVEKIRVRKIK